MGFESQLMAGIETGAKEVAEQVVGMAAAGTGIDPDGWEWGWEDKEPELFSCLHEIHIPQSTHRNLYSFLTKQGSVDCYGWHHPIHSANILHPWVPISDQLLTTWKSKVHVYT